MSEDLDVTQPEDLSVEAAMDDDWLPPLPDDMPESERAAYEDDSVDDALIGDELTPPAVAPVSEPPLIDIEAAYADADATLSNLYDDHAELGRQLDEGEIGEGHYQSELLKLNRQIEKAQTELDAIEGERSQKLNQFESARQAEEQKFADAVDAFLARPENASIVEGSDAWNVLDAQIKMLAGVLPQNTPYDQLLEKARAATSQIVDLPTPSGRKAVPSAKPLRNNAMPPPTLSSMPAAATNESSGEFDHIEKLSGEAYERAIGQLSKEQRNRLLMGG